MKKSLFFILCIIASHLYGKSYYSVTDQTQVSLLTTSPGQESYATFGHTAIRIKDTLGGFDLVFNYGAFDFDEPHFYWHFIRGSLNYSLVIVKTEDFIKGYREEDRSIIENKLHLDSAQKQKIFDYLMWNAELENRDYKYDFFYNNCATRIRDVFETQLGDSLHLDYKNNGFQKKVSMRRMLDLYLVRKPWDKLKLYLILGLPSDIEATPQRQVFLPDYLKVAFAGATNCGRPLSGNDVMLYSSRSMNDSKSYSSSIFDETCILPFIVFVLFSVFSLLRWHRAISFVIYLLTGTAGLFFLFMWFDTDQLRTYQNLNLLWALPWHLIVVLLMFKKKYNDLVSNYNRAYGLWLILLFFISFILPQPFHICIRISILIIGLFLSFLSERQKASII